MMTITETAAQAIYQVLDAGASEWKQAQAEKAQKIILELFEAKEIDAATFAGATATVSQNVSAMKQSLEKFGVLKNTSAMPALIVAIKKLESESVAAIASLPAAVKKPGQ